MIKTVCFSSIAEQDDGDGDRSAHVAPTLQTQGYWDNPAFLLASDPAQLNSDAYVALRFPNKSRLLMTSGNDYPLPRADLTGTSVFADALVDTLKSNTSVMTAPALFLSMIQKLENRQPDLSPQFKAIKRAGDEVGDFFFVAR